jgi:hypothetical protein
VFRRKTTPLGRRFDLPGGGIGVTLGQPLTILLQDTGKIVFWWRYKNGSNYPPGQAYSYGSALRDNDFFFRTYGTNKPLWTVPVETGNYVNWTAISGASSN